MPIKYPGNHEPLINNTTVGIYVVIKNSTENIHNNTNGHRADMGDLLENKYRTCNRDC